MYEAVANFINNLKTGSVFILSKNLLKWHVIYIGTQDGDVKQTYYTNPQPGGQFHVNGSLQKKFPFLRLFASTKPIATLILEQVTGTNGLLNSVSKIACEKEICHIKSTRRFLMNYVKYQKLNHMKLSRHFDIFYEYYSSKYLNYTIVMHPVGRHHDVFADNLPSLENRVCFCVDKVRTKLSVLPYGRGGCGVDRFCFAILDWETKHLADRSTWTAEANKNLMYSAYWYALQGKVDQRFTENVKKNFFQSNTHLTSQSMTE